MKHPLNYRGGWTNYGCVIIKHETGDRHGHRSRLLLDLHAPVGDPRHVVQSKRSTQGRGGTAGKIYGIERQLHCEDTATGREPESPLGRTIRTCPNTDGRHLPHLPAGATYQDHRSLRRRAPTQGGRPAVVPRLIRAWSRTTLLRQCDLCRLLRIARTSMGVATTRVSQSRGPRGAAFRRWETSPPHQRRVQRLRRATDPRGRCSAIRTDSTTWHSRGHSHSPFGNVRAAARSTTHTIHGDYTPQRP